MQSFRFKSFKAIIFVQLKFFPQSSKSPLDTALTCETTMHIAQSVHSSWLQHYNLICNTRHLKPNKKELKDVTDFCLANRQHKSFEFSLFLGKLLYKENSLRCYSRINVLHIFPWGSFIYPSSTVSLQKAVARTFSMKTENRIR